MRIFTERERNQMSRKPCELDEVGGVAMSDARIAELAVAVRPVAWMGDIPELDRVIKARRALRPDEIEFLAYRGNDGSIWAVNTEGGDYARYMGQVR